MTSLEFDPLLVWMAAAWLAVLMLHAGLAHTLDRDLFMQHLGAYRVPDALITPLAWALPSLELLCGAGLLTPWRAWAAGVCAALLTVYALAMAWHLAAGRSLDCGCGGEPLPLSWFLVARNVALLLVCVVASATTLARELHVADQAVVLAAVLLGALLWAAFHQVLRHMRRPFIV